MEVSDCSECVPGLCALRFAGKCPAHLDSGGESGLGGHTLATCSDPSSGDVKNVLEIPDREAVAIGGLAVLVVAPFLATCCRRLWHRLADWRTCQ